MSGFKGAWGTTLFLARLVPSVLRDSFVITSHYSWDLPPKRVVVHILSMSLDTTNVMDYNDILRRDLVTTD